MGNNAFNILRELFLPILVGTLINVISFFVKLFTGESRLGKEWKCRYVCPKNRYMLFLYLSIIATLIVPFVAAFFCVMMELVIEIDISAPSIQMLLLILCIIIFLIVIRQTIIFNEKYNIFRTKKQSKLFQKNIIIATFMPIIVLLFLKLVGYSNSIFSVLSLFALLIVETIGLLKFEDVNILEFKKAKIIMIDNKKILRVESNNIRVKDKWFIFRMKDGALEKEIHIEQGRVYQIEYYDKNPDY